MVRNERIETRECQKENRGVGGKEKIEQKKETKGKKSQTEDEGNFSAKRHRMKIALLSQNAMHRKSSGGRWPLFTPNRDNFHKYVPYFDFEFLESLGALLPLHFPFPVPIIMPYIE